MKIAYCADLHLASHRVHGGPIQSGVNFRGQLAVDCLKLATHVAMKAHANWLVALGDVFDHTRPEPQLTTMVQEVLKQAGPSFRTTLMVGNHDQHSTSPGDHALGPLSSPTCQVVELPKAYRSNNGWGMALLPFNPLPAMEWLPKAIADMGTQLDGMRLRILGLHLGIADSNTPEYIKGAHDAIDVEVLTQLASKAGFSYVFAGNWHGHQQWDRNGVKVVQVGTLCPTGWDNPGLAGYGTVVVFDTETGAIELSEVPGPRFLKLNSSLDVTSIDWVGLRAKGHVPFVRYEVPVGSARMAEATAWLEAQVAAGLIVAGDVMPDKDSVALAAIDAAQAASGAGTLQQALTRYVAGVELPEGVTRERVLQLTNHYLNEARNG